MVWAGLAPSGGPRVILNRAFIHSLPSFMGTIELDLLHSTVHRILLKVRTFLKRRYLSSVLLHRRFSSQISWELWVQVTSSLLLQCSWEERQKGDAPSIPSCSSLCWLSLLLGLRQFQTLIASNLAFPSKFLMKLSFVLTCRCRWVLLLYYKFRWQ